MAGPPGSSPSRNPRPGCPDPGPRPALRPTPGRLRQQFPGERRSVLESSPLPHPWPRPRPLTSKVGTQSEAMRGEAPEGDKGRRHPLAEDPGVYFFSQRPPGEWNCGRRGAVGPVPLPSVWRGSHFLQDPCTELGTCCSPAPRETVASAPGPSGAETRSPFLKGSRSESRYREVKMGAFAEHAWGGWL